MGAPELIAFTMKFFFWSNNSWKAYCTDAQQLLALVSPQMMVFIAIIVHYDLKAFMDVGKSKNPTKNCTVAHILPTVRRFLELYETNRAC